jgi:hypothetical protein
MTTALLMSIGIIPRLTPVSASNPTAQVVTLTQLVNGNLASIAAKKQKGTVVGGKTVLTKTLGLGGSMVEVTGVKVQVTKFVGHDGDFKVEVTDGKQSFFITEDVQFPQGSKNNRLVTTNINVGDVIDIVGTPYHDGKHWEIHPVFAWGPTGSLKGSTVCAPAGTISSSQSLCWNVAS